MFAKTLGQTGITFLGTFLNGLLGLLFYILVARFLGPASFGILTLAITTLTLIADIADLGTDTGLIRFVGRYINADQDKALRFMKLGLKIKLAVWVIILGVGWLLMPFISSFVFGKVELELPLRLSLIGVGGALLFSFVSHSLQAMQHYVIWSLLNIGLNGLRLILVLILAVFTVESVLLAYIIIPFLGFFLGLLFLPRFMVVKDENSVAVDFFHYNKWVASTSLISAVSSRLDTFLLARLVSASSLGIYSAANQLTMVVPQLVAALATVIAPKLSAAKDKQEILNYLKRLQLLSVGLALLGLLGIPLAHFAIPFFYGQAFGESINIFAILFLSQLIFLMATPAHQAIFYYFAKPKVFVFISLGQLLILAFLGYFLILRLGMMGVALAVLVSQIFSLVSSVIWMIYKFKKA